LTDRPAELWRLTSLRVLSVPEDLPSKPWPGLPLEWRPLRR